MSFVVAASGGLDSMSLLELLYRHNYSFVVMHVNYGLRGADSEADQQCVEDWCNAHGVDCHIVQAKEELQKKLDRGENLQNAAREIRYRYLEQLRVASNAEVILTAHHAQDRLEGFFISLIRGESWRSLAGLPLRTSKVARPLYRISKEELETFAKELKITWRQDESNLTDAYLRNRIRNTIVPFIQEESPSWQKNLDRIQDALKELRLEDDKGYLLWKDSILPENNAFLIPRKGLNEQISYLNRWLLEQTNSSIVKIQEIPATGNGQVFQLNGYTLRLERDYLEFFKTPSDPLEDEELSIYKTGEYEWGGVSISIEEGSIEKGEKGKSQDIAILDQSLCPFPWKVRNWRNGDRFRPIGMKGSKLLSDYYIDKKFTHRQKQSTPLLIVGGEIAWVAGHRVDERFASTKESKEVFVVRKLEHKEK